MGIFVGHRADVSAFAQSRKADYLARGLGERKAQLLAGAAVGVYAPLRPILVVMGITYTDRIAKNGGSL